jgi:hypothetical protein
MSIALYGLVVFYTLVKERLAGKRPMTKFVVIKLLVSPKILQSEYHVLTEVAGRIYILSDIHTQGTRFSQSHKSES